MEPSLYSIDSWRYLQEGNENIVFSYTGSSLKYQNFVLRLPKCIPGAPSKENNAEANASLQKLFYELVVCPLLGKQYLQEKISVPVGSEFLSKLNSEALKVRPATRQHKHIDTDIQQMILTENLLHMSGSARTFSPKWGFLPTWQHLPPESPKLSNCRFCMHQKLKAIEDGKAPSKFCPLLLFDSDPLKKYRAVQQLFETPQNNLRCFLDGVEIDPDTASQEISKEFDSQDEFLLQKMLASVLVQDGVLNRIKVIQRDFDLYDVEGIYKMLETMDKSAISEANEQQWKELIQSYLKESEQVFAKDISLLSPSEKVALVHSFMISATFKDCSVIISFASNQSSDESKQFTLEPELATSDSKLMWAYQLGVVDLDPKPLKKLDGYIELDQKITQAFLEKTDNVLTHP